MNNRVLFVICNRNKDIYGITSGLFNSASFVSNYLNTQGFDSKLISVIDSNSIDKEVTKFDPGVVIIEALWVPPGKFQELLKIKRHANRRWIVRVHSKAPFLANESLATKWIRDYACIENGKIEIAPNTQEFTEQLTSAFPYGTFVFLPNIYFPNRYEHDDACKTEKEYINVGCFGAIRPMKNTYQQALAAIEFATLEKKILHFHINSSRMEQNGENVVKNLRALFQYSEHKLIEHPWYTHKSFMKIARTMDIGSQVSFSESFNIVTADFVTAGVPIVASNDIEWMPFICKTSPTSHKKMVKKMRLLYRWKKTISFIQKLKLKFYNITAENIWLNVLDGPNINECFFSIR